MSDIVASESEVTGFDAPGLEPNITRLKRHAKSLKKAVAAGDKDALGRVAAQDVDPGPPFSLRSAQYVLAKEHGYAGWYELISDVGARMVDERDIHRWFGVDLNNRSWELIDAAEDISHWPKHKVEEALYRTYASTYHWMQIGTPMQQGRGEYLISRMAVVIGRPELALGHADRYVEIVASHGELAEDWDRAFAVEGRSRALAANGRLDEARAAKRHAEELCASIEDPEDRKIVEGALSQEPWFGV